MAMREQKLNGSMNKLNEKLAQLSTSPVPPKKAEILVPPTPVSNRASADVYKIPQQKMTVRNEPKPFEPKPIEISNEPFSPEVAAKFKKPPSSNYPDWFLITLAYSFVFVIILLMSNITPNGKLYIHFTAFFSLILYFVTDDVDKKSTDIVLDTVMENFVKK